MQDPLAARMGKIELTKHASARTLLLDKGTAHEVPPAQVTIRWVKKASHKYSYEHLLKTTTMIPTNTITRRNIVCTSLYF